MCLGLPPEARRRLRIRIPPFAAERPRLDWEPLSVVGIGERR